MIYTSFRSLCEASAEAVKTKLETSSDVKGDDVPSNIALIPTGSGGLHLDTTLTLTSDKSKSTGPVTLTAVLQADYDTLDTDLKGYLSNALITLYGSDNSVYRSITNLQGEAVFNVTITENTTFYCSFTGTQDYEPSNSDNVTVEWQDILFEDDCTGTNPSELWNVASPTNPYYSTIDGYNVLRTTEGIFLSPKNMNSIPNDLEITLDFKSTGTWTWFDIGIKQQKETTIDDYTRLINFSCSYDTQCNYQSIVKYCKAYTPRNTWNNLKVIKQGNDWKVYLNNTLEGEFTFNPSEYNYIGICVPYDCYVKNIKMK